MRRSINALAAVAALALILAGCASGKATGLPAGPTTAPASKLCSTIDMNDALKFVPDECTAQVGQSVTWDNVGGVPHTVTATDGKTFDSGSIAGGREFKFTFKTPGEIAYYCVFHSTDKVTGMVGKIKVEAASGTGSSPGAASPS